MSRQLVRSALAAAVLSLAAVLTLAGAARAQMVVPGEEHCVVNVRADDALNMRDGPSVRYPVSARKRYGECGILVRGPCRGSWCPVEDGHSVGWVHRRYIAMVSPALYCVSGVAPDDVLNLRAFPAATSRILRTLPPHQCDIAFLPYSVGNWQKIRVGGFEGWVNRSYLSGQ